MCPLASNSVAVEAIRVIRTKCLQRLQYIGNRRQIGNVLLNMIVYVRDLIDERLVPCANRQPGAVDERAADAAQAQQSIT